MKKILLTCLTGLLLTWTITSSYSQSSKGIGHMKFSQEDFNLSAEEGNTAENLAPIAPDYINTKAVKAFAKTFKNVPDARWFQLKDGFVAKFNSGGIETRAYYTKKGHDAGIVRSYLEDKLPSDVRHLIKSTYYDFSIYHINEVSVNGKTAYLVKMQDNTSWKTIKVIDGEMEVTEEFKKG